MITRLAVLTIGIAACTSNEVAQRASDSLPSPAPDSHVPLASTAMPLVSAHTDSLFDVVIANYTEPDSMVEGRFPTNRFRAVGGTRLRSSSPDVTPCEPRLAYLDGLVCASAVAGQPYEATPSVWVHSPVLTTAEAVARSVLGERFDSLGRFLIYAEVTEFSTTACLTFRMRRLGKLAHDGTQADIWADAIQQFATFACRFDKQVLSPMTPNSSIDSATSYLDVAHYRIWDQFELQDASYLLVLHNSCAGECEAFEVYELGSGSLVKVLEVPLWSL